MSKVQVWQCAEQLCHPRFFFRCCIFANSLPLMNSTSFNVVSVWRKYILCTMKWMILCNILTDHHKFFCCLPTSEQNIGSLFAMLDWLWSNVVSTNLPWRLSRAEKFRIKPWTGGGGNLFWPGWSWTQKFFCFMIDSLPLQIIFSQKWFFFLGKEGNATQL